MTFTLSEEERLNLTKSRSSQPAKSSPYSQSGRGQHGKRPYAAVASGDAMETDGEGGSEAAVAAVGASAKKVTTGNRRAGTTPDKTGSPRAMLQIYLSDTFAYIHKKYLADSVPK